MQQFAEAVPAILPSSGKSRHTNLRNWIEICRGCPIARWVLAGHKMMPLGAHGMCHSGCEGLSPWQCMDNHIGKATGLEHCVY